MLDHENGEIMEYAKVVLKNSKVIYLKGPARVQRSGREFLVGVGYTKEGDPQTKPRVDEIRHLIATGAVRSVAEYHLCRHYAVLMCGARENCPKCRDLMAGSSG